MSCLPLCFCVCDADEFVSINTPLGMNVTLHCNSSDNVLKTEWTKDGIQVFIHSPLLKKNGTKRNFTSERMSVDPATPMILQISDVQVSDEGIYTCEVTDKKNVKTEKWSLTTSPGMSFAF